MTYQGQCFCGRIKFVVEGELRQVLANHDSLHNRRGSLLWLIPMTQFQEISQTAQAVASTTFCNNCGLYPYVQKQKNQTVAMLAVDLRCLDKIHLEELRITNLLGHRARA